MTVTFPENVFIPSRETDKLPSEPSLTWKDLSPFLLVASPYMNSPRSPQFKKVSNLREQTYFLYKLFPFLEWNEERERERERERGLISLKTALIHTNAHPSENGLGMSIHVSMCGAMEYDQNYFCCCFNFFYTFSDYVCGQRYVPLRLHPCAGLPDLRCSYMP